MQELPKAQVNSWEKVEAGETPAIFRHKCPHCSEWVVWQTVQHKVDPRRKAVLSDAKCANCNRPIVVISVSPPDGPLDIGRARQTVFVYPASQTSVRVPQATEGIPEPLRRALDSTVRSLESKNYGAATVGARRTLEGIFKYLLEESKRKKPLAQLIDTAKAEVDLAAPLTKLSHAIRDGGNLGAHFDMESEPDEAIAKQVVDLTVYLIDYLYVLPKKIGQLETSLGKPPKAPKAKDKDIPTS